MTPSEYNATRLADGRITPEHVTVLVRDWQKSHGLTVDGLAGPATIASIESAMPRTGDLRITADWLTGPGVTRIEAHPTWYGPLLTTGAPRGIVAHYTATDPGTAVTMAKHRVPALAPDDRVASWHLTIETDGSVVQMIPFSHVAWHAGSSTAKPVPGLGQANYNTVGIELVGYGKSFTTAQVESAKRVWRAIVQRYGIKREYAMLQHSVIDPERRDDPGPVWAEQHAELVLDAAFT